MSLNDVCAPLFRGCVSGLVGLEQVSFGGAFVALSALLRVFGMTRPYPPTPPPPGCQGSEAASILQWRSCSVPAKSLVLWAGVSQAPPGLARIGSGQPHNRAC